MAGVMDSVDQRTQLAGHNRLELLTFRLNGRQRYAINVFKIQEVLQCPKLTQIPQSHSVVRGVATLRGKTVPVMDLGMAIGQTAVQDLDQSFLIVTEYNRTTQGFLVSGVERIVNLNWADVSAPPKGAGANSYLTAVTKLDDSIVEILDVEKILAEVSQVSAEISDEIVANLPDTHPELHALVADDSSVARMQVKQTLDQLGIACTVVNTGAEALKVLKGWADNNDPLLEQLALIVSDIEMPDMDGYTLTTEIRKDPRLADLFVLLHTSLSGTFNKAMVEKVGADRFVPKFKPDELATAVIDRVKAIVEQKAD